MPLNRVFPVPDRSELGMVRMTVLPVQAAVEVIGAVSVVVVAQQERIGRVRDLGDEEDRPNVRETGVAHILPAADIAKVHRRPAVRHLAERRTVGFLSRDVVVRERKRQRDVTAAL